MCAVGVLPRPRLHCLCSAVSRSAGLLTEFLPQHAESFNSVVAGGGMITLQKYTAPYVLVRAQTTRWHTVESSGPSTLPPGLARWRCLTCGFRWSTHLKLFSETGQDEVTSNTAVAYSKRLQLMEKKMWPKDITRAESVLKKARGKWNLSGFQSPCQSVQLCAQTCFWVWMTLFSKSEALYMKNQHKKTYQCFFTQNTAQPHSDGFIAFACKVAPSVWTSPHKFVLVRSQPVTSISDLTAPPPVSISRSLCPRCVS